MVEKEKEKCLIKLKDVIMALTLLKVRKKVETIEMDLWTLVMKLKLGTKEP
jgi:hypothetical protein